MNKYLLIILLIIGFVSCQSENEGKTESTKLPFYGEKEYIEGIDKDTLYHSIPFWSFVNQDGRTISKSDYAGKVYVADFFFTHCPGICATLTKNMKHIQAETKDIDVSFLSHTVDPIRDSVERLQRYIEQNELDNSNWDFITGDQYTIYELGVNGYLVPNQEDALAPGGFLHSDKFILIDQKSRIRGMYSGGDDKEVGRLIEDIKTLSQEK